MLFRVAIVTEILEARLAAVRDAFQACAGDIEVVLLPRRGRRVASPTPNVVSIGTSASLTLSDLFTYRPHLVISADRGSTALQAALYRHVAPRSRLLLCPGPQTTEAGQATMAGRAIRWAADAVLSPGNPVAQAVEQLRLPASLLTPTSAPGELDSFLACPRSRSEVEARRIVFAGDLSPQSGAADLMIGVASWAERNPNRDVEIWWIGDGDLAGVLDAQPLPPGVTQRFLGQLEPQAMAKVFAQCGMLAVPSLVDSRNAMVIEALAAGLPVLGSRIDRSVRRWVQDEVNGWLFDALQPETVTRALGRALGSSLPTLEYMRECAQATVRPVARGGLSERFMWTFGTAPAEFPGNALAPVAH